MPFALVPWGQHIEIISRSESVEEAVFYVHQVIEKGLIRPALINCFKARLYETLDQRDRSLIFRSITSMIVSVIAGVGKVSGKVSENSKTSDIVSDKTVLKVKIKQDLSYKPKMLDKCPICCPISY